MGNQLDNGFYADSMMDRRTLIGTAVAGVAGLTASRARAAASEQVVELRQYTLHKGQRETLIGLFEQHFIEPQDALGAQVLGTFRDRDDPDRFVWLRGFENMERRQQALTAFYDGPVWQRYRGAANPTMLDSDNVLLLKLKRGAIASRQGAAAMRLTIHYVGKADPKAFLALFEGRMRPLYEDAGAPVQAVLLSAMEANNYPRLPIREDDRVLVWLTRFASVADEERFDRAMRQASGWRDQAPEMLLPAFMRKPEVVRLAPTVRSPAT
jgi:hypothetical protein